MEVLTGGICQRNLRFSARILVRYLLLAVLVFTVFINFAFILETSKSGYRRFGVGNSDEVGRRAMNDNDDDDDDNDEDEDDDDDVGGGGGGVGGSGRFIDVRATSSKDSIEITAAGVKIVNDTKNRGIHVAVLHQATGVLMAHRFYDTYSPHEDEALILFLNMISPGRILIFTILDEGSFHLKKVAKDLLKEQYGSKECTALGWRDMWVMVTMKGGATPTTTKALGETLSKSPSLSEWGLATSLHVEVPLVNQSMVECDQWPKDEESRRRRSFCNQMEGYGSVCSCSDPAPMSFAPDPIPDVAVARLVADIPIIVIASARPHYLYRMLRALMSASGVNPANIVVFIDGHFEEPQQVATLFGVRSFLMTPKGEKNGRISHHYKSSLAKAFDLFPTANYTVILEEDLDVSPDILYYFGQLLPIYESDPTVYCVSAWNDHGYEHACGDPALVNRVETMPGLGWLLKKSLFKTELEPNWPAAEKRWDWDMWMRLPTVRKNRECLYPDVSRTYHFGASGLNMNPYFQELYFKKHSLNTLPHIVLNDLDKLDHASYETNIKALLSIGVPVDHVAFADPCGVANLESLFPAPIPLLPASSSSRRHKPRILFIEMKHESDFETWISLAKCLRLWDLDVRGVHKSSWRLFVKSTPFFVIGVPASPYASFKPADLRPVFIPRTTATAAP